VIRADAERPICLISPHVFIFIMMFKSDQNEEHGTTHHSADRYQTTSVRDPARIVPYVMFVPRNQTKSGVSTC